MIALDWDCLAADTRYLTHGIHRYSGKFIPQIARQAVELLTRPGDLVLDPMCGSGTTLLESALAGRRCVGVDLSPLACLVAAVKTTRVSPDRLRDSAWRLEVRVRARLGQRFQLDLFNSTDGGQNPVTTVSDDPRWGDPWHRKWFAAEALQELIVLHQEISRESESTIRNALLVAFSDVLRTSSNAHSGYPNVMFDRHKPPPRAVCPRYFERLRDVIASVVELDEALCGQPVPVVVGADASALPLADEVVDAIVTHPPYIGSIPYAEYGVLSLTWLGCDPRRLDERLTGGRRQSQHVVQRYSESFGRVISESARVLKRGHLMFMLVGNPVVKGARIDLADLTVRLCQERGFHLDATHHRRGKNRRANLMGDETMLVFVRT